MAEADGALKAALPNYRWRRIRHTRHDLLHQKLCQITASHAVDKRELGRIDVAPVGTSLLALARSWHKETAKPRRSMIAWASLQPAPGSYPPGAVK